MAATKRFASGLRRILVKRFVFMGHSIAQNELQVKAETPAMVLLTPRKDVEDEVDER